MGALPTVRIKNPNEPGDFIIINESDFNPTVHEKFEGEVKPATTKPKVKGGKTDGGSSFPEGYRYEPAKGGYGLLYHGDEVIEGPSNGKWQGEDAARAAAVDHAKHAAETE